MSENGKPRPHELELVRLGIDTYQEPVAFIHRDCPVCRSEGLDAQSRVLIRADHSEIVATLNVVTSDIVSVDQLGLSEAAWRRLNVESGSRGWVRHPRTLESLGHVRAKIFGERLDLGMMQAVMTDVVQGRYRDIHIAAFLTACATAALDFPEVEALTKAMVGVGERLRWSSPIIVDKHCVGGLPGNRTTPLVVPIVAAMGLTMPKTSSRAITSPAGTADAMECLAPVDLSLTEIRRVVKQVGACIAWGGAVQLSPTDDIFIRIERALDLDGTGQMIASILSKKVAAGATHVVIDIPVGPTAKIRDARSAARLAAMMRAVGHSVGIEVRALVTDGTQPIGVGIGPALEAHDILKVLRNDAEAPADLVGRALLLAGEVAELAGVAEAGRGVERARDVLADGRAWAKFQEICEAQGGMREPPVAGFSRDVLAERDGVVMAVDNRRIANAAKLAGAPNAPSAGISFYSPVGRRVKAGDRLFTLHAESRGELAYALEYLTHHPNVIEINGGV